LKKNNDETYMVFAIDAGFKEAVHKDNLFKTTMDMYMRPFCRSIKLVDLNINSLLLKPVRKKALQYFNLQNPKVRVEVRDVKKTVHTGGIFLRNNLLEIEESLAQVVNENRMLES